MARRYDVKAVLGEDFECKLTPDVLAYEVSMDFSNQIIIDCFKISLLNGTIGYK